MNNTTHSLVSEQLCSLNSQQRFLKILAVSVVTLAAYFGNSLILITLRRFSTMFKGNLYLIIAHLAVADLLLAFGLTLQLAEFVFMDLESNRYFCLLKTCCLVVSLTCSSDMLSYMSIDRFCAIMFPMKHLLNSSRKKGKRFILAITWLFSILIGCVPIFISVSSNSISSNTIESQYKFSCKFGSILTHRLSYVVAIFLPLEFGFNMLLFLVVVFRVLTNNVARHKYKKSMIKCALTLQVYFLFAICWAPYEVTTFLMETNGNENKYFCLREYAMLLGFLNSGINWIIYGLANKKFRKSFKRMLTCNQLKKQRGGQADSNDQNERLNDIVEPEIHKSGASNTYSGSTDIEKSEFIKNTK